MRTEEHPGQRLLSKRILLVTGKGGVGKTTLVASLARYAASRGERVLALDMERSLETPSQLLKMLGGGERFPADEPLRIAPGLECARLSSTAGHRTFLEESMPFRWLARSALRSAYLQRFLNMAPGFQDLGILYRIMPYIRQKDRSGAPTYARILVDLPATGHALALTSIPAPMLKVFDSGPIADGIREAQGYFNDSTTTGALVVSLPEPLVISETLELVEGLRRDDVAVAGLVINQLPHSPWSQQQREQLLQMFSQIDAPLLGQWSLERIHRAYAAVESLQASLEGAAGASPGQATPYTLIDEHAGDEGQRIEAILSDWQRQPEEAP